MRVQSATRRFGKVFGDEVSTHTPQTRRFGKSARAPQPTVIDAFVDLRGEVNPEVALLAGALGGYALTQVMTHLSAPAKPLAIPPLSAYQKIATYFVELASRTAATSNRGWYAASSAAVTIAAQSRLAATLSASRLRNAALVGLDAIQSCAIRLAGVQELSRSEERRTPAIHTRTCSSGQSSNLNKSEPSKPSPFPRSARRWTHKVARQVCRDAASMAAGTAASLSLLSRSV
jgi:hypothetical protein